MVFNTQIPEITHNYVNKSVRRASITAHPLSPSCALWLSSKEYSVEGERQPAPINKRHCIKHSFCTKGIHSTEYNNNWWNGRKHLQTIQHLIKGYSPKYIRTKPTARKRIIQLNRKGPTYTFLRIRYTNDWQIHMKKKVQCHSLLGKCQWNSQWVRMPVIKTINNQCR